jgi:hypothetical protein
MQIRTVLIATIALAGQLLAGGFFVELGNPSANPEAKAKNAVLLVRVSGCHDAAHAPISAVVEGTVDGKHKAIPLTLIPLSGEGMYAARREWPQTGSWVLSVVAKDGERVTSLVVPVDENGAVRKSAKWYSRAPTETEIASVLK